MRLLYSGELLYAASICFVGRSEVHHAEAIGIKESLSWIKAKVDSGEGSGDPCLTCGL